MSAIVKAAHGLVAGQRVAFSNLVGGVGIDPDFVYYVVPVVNVNDFQIAETDGGTPITFTTVTSANMQVVPETETTDPYGNGTYVPITDPTDAMAPPTVPPTPSAPTVASAIVSGIVRLQITLNDTAQAKVRNWEVSVTHNFVGANPDWSNGGTKITMPEGSTAASLPALGSTVYAVRVSATDVYGNVSAFSPEVTHTTVAGSDALNAALASLTNDVADGIITETKIADGAISTPKLQAGSVTAQILAATIVLSSLIKTANSGRRIEIDVDGIRLYDTDESLLVRIPTNGDPVFIKGQVTADSLVSQVAASFRGTVDLAGNSVTTLQNGIAAPTTVPTLAASVDYLGLTSTPTNVGAGIAYDSGGDSSNGSFWVACDPTISPYYVAQEFAATAATGTAGRLLRTINATGSLSTTTATLGSTSHVSDTADGLVGSTDSHIASPLTIPTISGATNYKVTKVQVYMAGRSGTCATRNGVWDGSGNNLRESATYTAASGGATTVGASDAHNATLSSALTVSPGSTYRFGFRRVNTTDGSQHDKDDGSGKTTYSADGTTADGTGWGTRNSASKINVSATYTYDIDTRKETAKMIGVATDGTYVYTLDTLGQVWKYDRSTLAWVTNSGVQTAITGTKAQAGMFYDATAGELIITTTTGTGAGVFPKFVRVTPSTLAISSTVYSASAGTSFNGATDTFRGGARLADPLNASAATYWISTTNAVYAYTFSGTAATQTANRDFGQAVTVGDGLTYDGTQFRGFDTAVPTKLWKFSGWDWTTASSTIWVAYSWYDSNATGGTHETAMGPRSSIVMRRRERLQVQQPSIPTGGTDDPNNVRVYMLSNATDTGAGTFWLQVTDALTSRYITSFASSTHDGTGTAFPSGVPAEIKSSATGWSLKGDGTVAFGTGVTPGGKPATVTKYTTNGSFTYNRPAGLAYAIVEVVGAGGAGGGSTSPGASGAGKGGGGGAGGYSRSIITAAAMGASQTVTVGAGGTGVSAGTGNSGGDSSFGALVIGKGGSGAASNSSTTTSTWAIDGGAGGVAGTGDINPPGMRGGAGYTGGNLGGGGIGGSSPYGAGGKGAQSGSAGASVGGSAGTGNGSGGGGALTTTSGANATGGAGTDGIVIITEFYGA